MLNYKYSAAQSTSGKPLALKCFGMKELIWIQPSDSYTCIIPSGGFEVTSPHGEVSLRLAFHFYYESYSLRLSIN